MIRPLQPPDLAQVAAIWLDTNIQAHAFIPAEYWQGNFSAVREQLAQAEVYIYEAAEQVLGFIGLDGQYIAGLFVRPGAQGRGIGRQLLDFAKQEKGRLRLHVYQNNTRAVQFYLREQFVPQQESTDAHTGQQELELLWCATN